MRTGRKNSVSIAFARNGDESVPAPAAGGQARSSLEKRTKSAKSAGYPQISAGAAMRLKSMDAAGASRSWRKRAFIEVQKIKRT